MDHMQPNGPVPPYEALPVISKNPPNTHVQRDTPNVMDLEYPLSLESRPGRATSELSLDDLEAAHALEGLRAGMRFSPSQLNDRYLSQGLDYMSSPLRQPTLLPSKIDPLLRGPEESQQPEPLLSLITSQHPLISTAINGSLSAYSSSKSYSPRFRYGAEFVERHIGSPVATTVGTAGRMTGVETGVRWWLQRNDSSEMQSRSNKRRRIGGGGGDENADIEKGMQEILLQRRSSDMSCTESLPPYDDQRSPRYEEEGPLTQSRSSSHEAHSPHSRNWQTRLMMSTSGLGVAMSEESLRNLKYCLSWLRWANDHLGKVLSSLQKVLEEWDFSQHSSEDTSMDGSSDGAGRSRPSVRDQAVITRHIQALQEHVLQTLKSGVDIVSQYAGSALPENARILVKKHLTSLPQRFRLASTTTTPSSKNNSQADSSDAEKQTSTPETVTNAQRVIVLAKEGLDMMAQVSGVLDGTIVSAEEWCEKLGKRKGGDRERSVDQSGTTVEQQSRAHTEQGPPNEKGQMMTDGDDVKMGG